MKKLTFITFSVIALLAMTPSSVTAQCNGGNVLVTNIVVTNSGLTYNFSYNWMYIQGNASIMAVLKCDGVVVAESNCNADLKTASGSNTTIVFSASGSVTFPSTCSGVKEIEFRVYASSNCNGNFCPLPPLTPLPVSFKSFFATRQNSSVLLKWETATEQNNAGFTIERNTNGTWEGLATVPSKAADGNSTAMLTYAYTDHNPTRGMSQYRIRQTDFDGKTKFSTIQAIRGTDQIGEMTISPNPSTSGDIIVAFDDASSVRSISLLDLNGREVRSWTNAVGSKLSITGLSPGVYVLMAMTDAGVMSQKIMRQ